MDSAGLGALIGGIRRAREAGGDVAVACSRPTLTRLLHTTGFDRIVSVDRDASTTPPPPCRTPSPPAETDLGRGVRLEEVGGERGEAVEVVHVAAQERHPHHRRRRHRLGQAGEVLLLAGRHQRKSARLP